MTSRGVSAPSARSLTLTLNRGGNKSLRLDARRLKRRTPAMMLALQYVFLPHVFRSVFKLNIVCVLFANALECISLDMFLRNGLAPVRAKFPY